jgi:hypothetical protein
LMNKMLDNRLIWSILGQYDMKSGWHTWHISGSRFPNGENFRELVKPASKVSWFTLFTLNNPASHHYPDYSSASPGSYIGLTSLLIHPTINPVTPYPLSRSFISCLTPFSYTPHPLVHTPLFDWLLDPTPTCQDHPSPLTP